MMKSDYELMDAGNGRKLERFGDYLVDRPSVQAMWKKTLAPSEWKQAHLSFERITDKEGRWHQRGSVPASWNLSIGPVTLKVSPTPFGHLGVFPEHLTTWSWLGKRLQQLKTERGSGGAERPKVLNLFAYSGSGTCFLAKSGATVVHLDASKPMLAWAKENAQLSGCSKDAVIWVLDDVNKFVEREIRRGRLYDGIILDPPSFGRGPKKELFKIESDLWSLLTSCQKLLRPELGSFALASCHTPGISPQILKNQVAQVFGPGAIASGEMMNPAHSGLPLPTGIFSSWCSKVD
jgi:23S rRNA (cytosine1962-C5)-methyltransferase